MTDAARAVLMTLVAIVACVVATACSQPKVAPDRATAGTARGAIASLEGTSWVLAALRGQSETAGQPATAEFNSGRVHGTDGCNRYTAPITITGSTLTVGPRGATTLMECPPVVMAQANSFMAALTGARHYRVIDNRLELVSSSGVVLASMIPQSTFPVGAWDVIGINNGRQAVVGVLDDAAVGMTFTSDGTVAGSARCNQFTAQFVVDGDSLRFTPAAASRQMCLGEGVMEQEQAFLNALTTVTTRRMDGDLLELRGADGAMALLLRRVPG